MLVRVCVPLLLIAYLISSSISQKFAIDFCHVFVSLPLVLVFPL